MRKIILAVLLSSAASVATAGNAVVPGPLQAVSAALFGGFYPTPVHATSSSSAHSLGGGSISTSRVISASRTLNGVTATMMRPNSDSTVSVFVDSSGKVTLYENE